MDSLNRRLYRLNRFCEFADDPGVDWQSAADAAMLESILVIERIAADFPHTTKILAAEIDRLDKLLEDEPEST